MKTKLILNKLAKRFPKKYAQLWHDRVGHMAGKLPEDTKKIFLCLDFDETIYDQALAFKPDLIITHHPFIYGPRSIVFKRDEKKKELTELTEKNNLCVYSFHTNFDMGKDGMNDALVEKLHLIDVYAPEKCKMMRIGYLRNQMEVHDFAKLAKEYLNVPYGKLIAEGNKMVKKVGIIGGGGAGFYNVAQEEGADIYISGDAPHHVRRNIVRYKYNYLDLPHEIEKVFMPQMKKLLLEIDPSLEIMVVDHEKLPTLI